MAESEPLKVPLPGNSQRERKAKSHRNQVNHFRTLVKKFPVKTVRAVRIQDELDEVLDREDGRGRTPENEIVATATLQAMGGDKDARNWISDRRYGPVKQTVVLEISGDALRESDLATDLVVECFGDVDDFEGRFNAWVAKYQAGLRELASKGSLPALVSEPNPPEAD